MTEHDNLVGIAALTICEALLLAMNDHKLLRDSAASHENAIGSDSEIETHRVVAELINRVNASGNSVRRP